MSAMIPPRRLAARAVAATVVAWLAMALPLPSMAGPAEAGGARQVLTFGIVPQQSASRLAAMWAPVLTYLSKETNLELRFQTTRDIPTFEACLAVGRYDLAYMNPYHYTVFSRTVGYRALAHQSGRRLQGLVVVHQNSLVRVIDDLDGQVVAFPSPGAFGASILPRAEMRARGIDFEPRYVTSHDSVYRAVAAGLLTAGGGVLRTFNAVEPAVRAQLRVVYRTEGYTPHAIAASPKLPGAVRAVLRKALAGMDQSAPNALRSIGMTGLSQSADADWNDVRRLSIDAAEAGLETGETRTCPSG